MLTSEVAEVDYQYAHPAHAKSVCIFGTAIGLSELRKTIEVGNSADVT